jgi:hypothetical protein
MYDIASKTPFLGNPYIKFNADLGRIIKNSVLRKPLATTAYATALYVVASMASKWSDEDEEIKKAREARPFIPKIPMPDWMELIGIHDIPLVWQTPVGEVNAARLFSPLYLYDTGDAGFMGSMEELSRFMPFQFNTKEEGEGGFPVEPKYQDVLLGPIANLMQDKDFRGKPILDPTQNKYYEGNATGYHKFMNASNYLAHQWIPWYDKAYAITQSARGDEDYYGRRRNIGQAILNQVVKVQKMDKADVIENLSKDIEYRINKFEALEESITKEANKTDRDIAEINANPDYSEALKKSKTDARLDAGISKINEFRDRQVRINDYLNKKMGLLEGVKKSIDTESTPK